MLRAFMRSAIICCDAFCLVVIPWLNLYHDINHFSIFQSDILQP
jgi:hypothetical protein